MPTARKTKSSKRPKTISGRATRTVSSSPEEAQEFPISHSTLRQMYDCMIESRLWAQARGETPRISEATAVPAALAVKRYDVFAAPADGLTLYPVTHKETVVTVYDPARIQKALAKTRMQHSHAVALALATEQDFETEQTAILLAESMRNRSPIVFVALSNHRFDPASAVIEIDVDGHDAVAVFRVVSEAIRRARNGRGPAVIHAHGATTPLTSKVQDNPLDRFQAYLNARGLSTDDIHVLHRD